MTVGLFVLDQTAQRLVELQMLIHNRSVQTELAQLRAVETAGVVVQEDVVRIVVLLQHQEHVEITVQNILNL